MSPAGSFPPAPPRPPSRSGRPGSKKRRRKGTPAQVGQMLETVLGDLGLEAAARAFRVGEIWSEVVGSPGADHSRPVGVRGDVLEIAVDSSVWCQQLQLEKERLMAGLRDRLGDEAPSDIRFRMGVGTS